MYWLRQEAKTQNNVELDKLMLVLQQFPEEWSYEHIRMKIDKQYITILDKVGLHYISNVYPAQFFPARSIKNLAL